MGKMDLYGLFRCVVNASLVDAINYILEIRNLFRPPAPPSLPPPTTGKWRDPGGVSSSYSCHQCCYSNICCMLKTITPVRTSSLVYTGEQTRITVL